MDFTINRIYYSEIMQAILCLIFILKYLERALCYFLSKRESSLLFSIWQLFLHVTFIKALLIHDLSIIKKYLSLIFH